MSMCKKICITNRKLVTGDFLEQIRRVAAGGVDELILREKDLGEAKYEALAAQVFSICRDAGVRLILHSYADVAIRLQIPYLHLPLPVFEQLLPEKKAWFQRIGVSVHSLEEARSAQALGAAYVTYSPVFATDCKPGCQPCGLQAVRQAVQELDLEVYALGGIHPSNWEACAQTGVAGICMMSEYMKQLG